MRKIDSAVLATRASIIQYLKANVRGRQGAVAQECGISRTHLNRYINGAAVIADVDILVRLERWVAQDQRA